MMPSRPKPERENFSDDFKGLPSITRTNKHKIISEIEIKDTDYCEKHGKYEIFTTEEKLNGKHFVKVTCSECVKENDKAKRDLEKLESEWRVYESFLNALEKAGVTKRGMQKDFNSFIADTDKKKLALSKFKKFSDKNVAGANPGNLIVCGSVGTGKTHLSYSTIIESVKSKKQCRITKLIDMIRHIKSSWEKDSSKTEDQILSMYQKVPLLIIDEVGVQFGSDTEKMFIFDVINGRYESMLPTILISNLNMDGIKEVLGERVIDRLREDGGQVVVMDWESNRGK